MRFAEMARFLQLGSEATGDDIPALTEDQWDEMCQDGGLDRELGLTEAAFQELIFNEIDTTNREQVEELRRVFELIVPLDQRASATQLPQLPHGPAIALPAVPTAAEPIIPARAAAVGAQYVVAGAGVARCNGVYTMRPELRDGVPCWSNTNDIALLRYRLRSGAQWWYLADLHDLQSGRGDFYRVRYAACSRVLAWICITCVFVLWLQRVAACRATGAEGEAPVLDGYTIQGCPAGVEPVPAHIAELRVAAVDAPPPHEHQQQVPHAAELTTLQDMGFSQHDAAAALDLTGGSLDAAVMLITSGELAAMMQQRDGDGAASGGRTRSPSSDSEDGRLERPPRNTASVGGAEPVDAAGVWRTREQFADVDSYGDYIKATLQVGMRVRANCRAEGTIEQGDTGVYVHTNGGEPPCQVQWAGYGRKYWVQWHHIDIVEDPGVPAVAQPEPGVDRLLGVARGTRREGAGAGPTEVVPDAVALAAQPRPVNGALVGQVSEIHLLRNHANLLFHHYSRLLKALA
jgi:hypothetical protein